jgi:hypothetical protein
MSEVLSSLLSAVKPRPQLANPEVNSASKFVLDEAKFLADIYEEAPGGASTLRHSGQTSAPRGDRPS